MTMRTIHQLGNTPMQARGALARFAEALRGRGIPSVAEARERLRARPGFYASMGPDLREKLDEMEEPVLSGPAGGA
jgi:hypothetical protein